MKDKKLNNMVKILIDELKPERLILFDSRGKDTASFNSDYEIAIDSQRINLREKRMLKEKIDEIIGLHKFDLVFLKEFDKGFERIIKKKQGRLFMKDNFKYSFSKLKKTVKRLIKELSNLTAK
jgi:Polymerase beta, Nucleotidyltransferase